MHFRNYLCNSVCLLESHLWKIPNLFRLFILRELKYSFGTLCATRIQHNSKGILKNSLEAAIFPNIKVPDMMARDGFPFILPPASTRLLWRPACELQVSESHKNHRFRKLHCLALFHGVGRSICVYAQLSKVGEALLRDLKAKKVEFQDRRLDLKVQDGIFVPIRSNLPPSPLFTRMNSLPGDVIC